MPGTKQRGKVSRKAGDSILKGGSNKAEGASSGSGWQEGSHQSASAYTAEGKLIEGKHAMEPTVVQGVANSTRPGPSRVEGNRNNASAREVKNAQGERLVDGDFPSKEDL